MMLNKVPSDYRTFRSKIDTQIRFGVERMDEALRLQMNAAPTKAHLRLPINPRLLKSFTCENANVWKTNENSYCTKDWWDGCDRKTVASCQVVR
jgi:hypothetical protein